MKHNDRPTSTSDVLKIAHASLPKLGRALFEYQERVLPEGETWDELDSGERRFWEMSAEAVLVQLRFTIEESEACLPRA